MDANLEARNRLVARTENRLTWVRNPDNGEYTTSLAGLVIYPFKNDFIVQSTNPAKRLRGSLKYCKAIAEAWLRQAELEREVDRLKLEHST